MLVCQCLRMRSKVIVECSGDKRRNLECSCRKCLVRRPCFVKGLETKSTGEWLSEIASYLLVKIYVASSNHDDAAKRKE